MRGDLESAEGVQNILKFFYNFSGLKINPSKCVEESVLEDIQRLTGFERSRLPVRYLGVPLITRKLSFGD